MSPIDIARESYLAAVDKKATNIVVLDLRGVSDLCDYQVICSADNDRHTRAVAEAIDARCRAVGKVRPLALEGKNSGNWILMDYGATIVHVFFAMTRDFYSIDQLWSNGRKITFS
jgi:ribosome-associated protein